MTAAAPPAARGALALPEFVALMAMLAATIAFSIDAMLPALPAIGAELSPDDPNAAQLIIVAFVLGMGGGTLFAGPLSDRLGRKPVMLAGAALYCAGAATAALAPTLEGVLAARVLQGVGAAGPRVVSQAMIRDLYQGRGMARVSSFVMTTFTLVPALAPLMGAGIIAVAGWRGVFWAFVVFSLISGAWLALRQPETLAPAHRRPLRLRPLLAAAREVVSRRQTLLAVAAQTMIFAILFSTIVSSQGIYAEAFGRAESFPYWFGAVAVISGGAALTNAVLVERLGMLYLLRRALAAHLGLSLVLALAFAPLPRDAAFALFLLWSVGSFGLAGLCIGNLNAIAMQPLGHVAGVASSLIAACATIAGVLLAAPIGQALDGTPVPLAWGVALLTAAALLCAAALREG